MPKYEFLLHYWGQAHEKIEKELGIKGNYLWFSNKNDRATTKDKINQTADRNMETVVFDEEEGEHVRLRTVANVVLEYEGKTYKFSHDFGYGYPQDAAEFMFEDGNYSCDCNRSSFIHDHYPEFEKWDECGDKIELKSLDIVFEA